ncbi:MAG: undecaprenyl-diphosphatase UppP [Desulfobacca sp. RBG_16_58_9]|nr:MAG: undecaprenyl-diphosphatase UppP [Desulfobacca sp. RBG_16_58_9]
MHPLEALFLGIVQGITEFLPISSSGHLALLEHYLKTPGGGLGFDILLHLGTLAALLLYFRRDWLDMAHAFISPTRYNRPQRKLLFFLIIAVIPGALAGVLLEKKAETLFRQPARIAILLGSVGLLLILAEKLARHRRPLDSLRLADACLIGLSQALAIMPGVSRSGITMTMALFLGFNRRSSAHFSFLLATPIIAGAGLHHIPKWLKAPPEGLTFLAAALGFLGAVIASYLTIKYLLRFLQHHTFYPFAVYRLLLAAVVLGSIFIWPSP